MVKWRHNLVLGLAVMAFSFPLMAEVLRDPTTPLGAVVNSGRAQSKMTLQAIFEKEDKSQVMINGKLLALGDRIGHYSVVKITDNSAVLRSSDSERILTLRRHVIETR